MATVPPAQAPPSAAPQMLQLAVPPGYRAGQTIRVAGPTGDIVEGVIPEGAVAGTVMFLAIPPRALAPPPPLPDPSPPPPAPSGSPLLTNEQKATVASIVLGLIGVAIGASMLANLVDMGGRYGYAFSLALLAFLAPLAVYYRVKVHRPARPERPPKGFDLGLAAAGVLLAHLTLGSFGLQGEGSGGEERGRDREHREHREGA